MTSLVNRREYDAFLSHAHSESDFAREIYNWLTETAGYRIWYDTKDMGGGTAISTGLNNAIENCRGAIVVASKDAIQSGWVQKEINVAIDENAKSSDFKFVPLLLDGADPGSLLRGVSWIKVPKPKLTAELAINILRGLHDTGEILGPLSSRDVYVSASWRPNDSASARSICKRLAKEKFRMVGDSKTQKGFVGDRITEIMKSCGAFVCIIPFRGAEQASATEKPYKYILSEIDTAVKLGLPSLIVADERVHRSDGDDSTWLRLQTDSESCSPEIDDAVRSLYFDWVEPQHRHFVFLATDLDSPIVMANSDIRRLIEFLTGMPTIVGTDCEDEHVQDEIMEKLRTAFLVVADITGNETSAFNIDVAIEAGIARASGSNLRLIARGEPRRPPFMLRTSGQLVSYRNDAELAGVIKKLVWPFRRRVINVEL